MDNHFCYTSFTFSYLAKARVMANTFIKYNPEVKIAAYITDIAPKSLNFNPKNEPFDFIFFTHELDIKDFHRWVSSLSVVEACTAIKGYAVLHLLNNFKAEKVIYLDPDIAVFSSLDEIWPMLENNNILLTPHHLSPEPSDNHRAILDNEIGPLKYGTYNLGFIAINNSPESRKFANWWQNRLHYYCKEDINSGLFTDQKWANHIPVFFNGVHIIKDPGYNVASWNLSQRLIEFSADGNLLVNQRSLRFFHFTKLGPLGKAMFTRYAKDNLEAYELWHWYENEVREAAKDLPDLSQYWYWNK